MSFANRSGYESLAMKALRDANWDGAKVFALLRLAEVIADQKGRSVGVRGGPSMGGRVVDKKKLSRLLECLPSGAVVRDGRGRLWRKDSGRTGLWSGVYGNEWFAHASVIAQRAPIRVVER